MRSIQRKSESERGFTIIELLTVMSVIILLIGLLVPALNMVKKYSKRVAQKNQFHTIEVAMNLFNAEWDGYPPSEAEDDIGAPYCGSMKLAEAMVGQDGGGFHPESQFLQDGSAFYHIPGADMSGRRMNLKIGGSNARQMRDIYADTGRFSPDSLVLCDIYTNVTDRTTGKLIGMPILYYRADTGKSLHDVSNPRNPNNIYDYRDNHELVALGAPFESGLIHPLLRDQSNPEGQVFYIKSENTSLTFSSEPKPHRANSYILWSAGWDGKYGTDDDVRNFGN